MSNGLDIEAPGVITEDRSYEFSFTFFQKPYESYYGTNVKLRYVIKASLLMPKYKSPVTKE